MHKILLPTIISFLLFSCNNTKRAKDGKIKTDAVKANLKGKVKSYILLSYPYVNNDSISGNIISKIEYRYNENGMITEFIEYSTSINAWKSKTITKYDEKGKKNETSKLKPDGSLDIKTVFKYDDYDNQIEINKYNSDNSLQHKEIKKFDSKGNEIEVNEYKSDGSLKGKAAFIYDERGNEVGLNFYKPDGSVNQKYTRKYDSENNMIELLTLSEIDSLLSKSLYKYDDKRNLIEANRYHSDGSLSNQSTFKFQYDKNNNWIKMTEYNTDKKPVRVDERVIEYYN